MKVRLSLISLLFLANSFMAHAQLLNAKSPVKTYGQLRVEGNKLLDQRGNPVVLRGMSYGWHNWWPRFYNAGTVNWLRTDWGCTVVRAAMGVDPGGNPDSGYLRQPQWSKQKIKTVVDAAIQEGIYVIIDWHTHHIHLDKAKAFFSEMAQTYGSYPNVIYEIFNEPDNTVSWDSVKLYADTIIKAIRRVDPDNIILVGNPEWDQRIDLVAANPITGYQNLMYTVHYYAASHTGWLRDRCKDAYEQGIPIFISESAGMDHTGNGPIDVKQWQEWIDWAETRKVSWIVWSVADKDEETCSVVKSTAASNGRWAESDLKESGVMARRLLRSYMYPVRYDK